MLLQFAVQWESSSSIERHYLHFLSFTEYINLTFITTILYQLINYFKYLYIK